MTHPSLCLRIILSLHQKYYLKDVDFSMSHNVTAIPLSPLECNLKIVLQSQLYQDSSEEQERVLQLVQEDARFASVSVSQARSKRCRSAPR